MGDWNVSASLLENLLPIHIYLFERKSATRFPRNISNHSKEATLLTQTLLSASYLPFIHCNDIGERGSLSPHPPLHCPRRKKKYGEESPLNCVKKQKKAIQWSTYSATFFPSLRGEVGRVLVFFLSMTNFGNDFFPVLCTSYILDWLARVAVRRQELRQKRGKNGYSLTRSVSKCWLDREWKTGELRIKVPFASQNG